MNRRTPFHRRDNLVIARALIREAQLKIAAILDDNQVTEGNFMYQAVKNLEHELAVLRPQFDEAAEMAHGHCLALAEYGIKDSAAGMKPTENV